MYSPVAHSVPVMCNHALCRVLTLYPNRTLSSLTSHTPHHPLLPSGCHFTVFWIFLSKESRVVSCVWLTPLNIKFLMFTHFVTCDNIFFFMLEYHSVEWIYQLFYPLLDLWILTFLSLDCGGGVTVIDHVPVATRICVLIFRGKYSRRGSCIVLYLTF